jgi:hypothetical protein
MVTSQQNPSSSITYATLSDTPVLRNGEKLGRHYQTSVAWPEINVLSVIISQTRCCCGLLYSMHPGDQRGGRLQRFVVLSLE